MNLDSFLSFIALSNLLHIYDSFLSGWLLFRYRFIQIYEINFATSRPSIIYMIFLLALSTMTKLAFPNNFHVDKKADPEPNDEKNKIYESEEQLKKSMASQ